MDKDLKTIRNHQFILKYFIGVELCEFLIKNNLTMSVDIRNDIAQDILAECNFTFETVKTYSGCFTVDATGEQKGFAFYVNVCLDMPFKIEFSLKKNSIVKLKET